MYIASSAATCTDSNVLEDAEIVRSNQDCCDIGIDSQPL